MVLPADATRRFIPLSVPPPNKYKNVKHLQPEEVRHDTASPIQLHLRKRQVSGAEGGEILDS